MSSARDIYQIFNSRQHFSSPSSLHNGERYASEGLSVFQAVIDAGLVPVILQIMDHGDYKSQKEAVWVITNLTSGSSLKQVIRISF